MVDTLLSNVYNLFQLSKAYILEADLLAIRRKREILESSAYSCMSEGLQSRNT